MLRIVFCGTPGYAVPTLEALIAAGHDVVMVLSQPDKPVGRDGVVAATPVKAAAVRHSIAVLQPATLKRNDELRAALEALRPDAMVVVAYGRILPQWMLDLPPLGCINAHGSLLPRWRGAAPIQWAIASGDTETGVTIMLMDAGLDTGAMLLKRAVPITAATTSPDLFERLSGESATLMVETLAGLAADSLPPEPQNSAQATLAPILTRDDGRIDWSEPASTIDRRFRAFQPWPGAFTQLRGKKLIVHGMYPADALHNVPPATLTVSGEELYAGCGNATVLHLTEVQLEGKKRMSAAEFLRGFQIKSGELLG